MIRRDRVVVLLRIQDRTVIRLTTVNEAFVTVKGARLFCVPNDYHWFDEADEGLTWCRANPEAVRILEAAVALGLEAPDEPF